MPESEIDEREKYWIKFYRDTVGCYSIQEGGQPKKLIQYVTKEQRKIVGEKNRQKMIGRKLPKETRQKMSQSRKGKHPNRKNDYLTLSQAKFVKESLVQGKTTRQICDELNVPYKGVNSILSNNNYSSVIVEGWEEWYKNHYENRKKRLTKEQIFSLVTKFKTGTTIEELSKEFNLTKTSIRRHIRKNT